MNIISYIRKGCKKGKTMDPIVVTSVICGTVQIVVCVVLYYVS